VFYIPYPTDVPQKANWWAALVNKSQVCPHKPNDGKMGVDIFQETVMNATHSILAALPQHLGDTSHGLEEVTVVSGTSSEEEEHDDVDEEEEQEWVDLETDTEEDDVDIHYHSIKEDSDGGNDDT